MNEVKQTSQKLVIHYLNQTPSSQPCYQFLIWLLIELKRDAAASRKRHQPNISIENIRRKIELTVTSPMHKIAEDRI